MILLALSLAIAPIASAAIVPALSHAASRARVRRARTSRRSAARVGRQAAFGASFPNCAAARAAGATPIRAGDPGYSRRLDRDGDGRACE